MKTNLAFVLETTETVEATGGTTLDPVQLDQLLRLGSAQTGRRARAARARRKLVRLQDNHSGMFPAFRVR
jgi:hypothetical protein